MSSLYRCWRCSNKHGWLLSTLTADLCVGHYRTSQWVLWQGEFRAPGSIWKGQACVCRWGRPWEEIQCILRMSYEGGRGGDKGNPIQKGHYLQKDSMYKARNYQVSENQSHQGTLCAFKRWPSWYHALQWLMWLQHGNSIRKDTTLRSWIKDGHILERLRKNNNKT